MISSRHVRWVGHVARVGGMRSYNILAANVKGGAYLRDLGVA